MTQKSRTAQIAALAIAGTAGVAAANVNIVGDAITVTVTNNLGSATLEIPLSDPDGDYTPGVGFTYDAPYSQGSPLALEDGGTTIALLEGLGIEFNFNPLFPVPYRISLDYNITGADVENGGPAPGPTFITIDTGLFDIPNIPASLALATANGGTTTGDRNVDGATGSSTTDFDINGGTNLFSFSDSQSAAANGTDADSFAVGIPQPVGAATTSLAVSIDAEVSQGDNINGTANFIFIPSPASLALIGLGLGVNGARRRR